MPAWRFPTFLWRSATSFRRTGTPKIAVHFAHRVGALVATLLILATTGHVFYHHRRRGELVRPSVLLLVLLAAQITLGALTVLTAKHYIINSLHVVTGASVLATSLVLTLARTSRASGGLRAGAIRQLRPATRRRPIRTGGPAGGGARVKSARMPAAGGKIPRGAPNADRRPSAAGFV